MGKKRDVEFRQIAVSEFKAADDGSGELIGYASVFENGPDSYGDVISKGAFAKTIKERIATGIVPLTDSHSTDCKHIIGQIVSAIEDEHGLLIRARFASDQHSQDCRQKAIDGIITGLSIGYITIRERYETDVQGDTLRYLDEVKLIEIALTALPAREDARIISTKSIESGANTDTTAGATETTLPEGNAGPDATTEQKAVNDAWLSYADTLRTFIGG